MATAGYGGGSTASGYETGTGGGGGAGGKFRKRPFRGTTQTTPYDRPPTALRNPTRNVGNWLSKMVVDPASKLVSAGAHYFFSSLLRKRLPPPSTPEVNQESSNGHLITIPGNHAGEVLGDNASGKCTNSSAGTGISDLEQMLKQKKFTRTEIDCLIDLLNSSTTDIPVGEEDKRTDKNLPEQESKFARHQGVTSSTTNEYWNARDGFDQTLTTPVFSSRVLDEDAVSPAELAKAYMGSRPMKVSSSRLARYSQAPREYATMLKSVPSPSDSSVAPKTTACTDVPNNSFTMLRSRGRSAIYSMARMPYSKTKSFASEKDTESSNYTNGGPPFLPSSKYTSEHDEQFVLKQPALKRTSSVIDGDISSFSSLRRVRQKSLPLSQGSLISSHGKQIGSDSHRGIISSTSKPLFITERVPVSKTVGESKDNIPSTSYASVPSKSSEMAAKILHQLEILTPKEKSLESKFVSAREKSPTKLTPGMLRGNALRSLEDVDSSKLLQNAEYSHKFNGSHDATSDKQAKLEENDPKLAYCDALIQAENDDTKVSIKDAVCSSRTAGAVTTGFITQPAKKKRAFWISAPEDSFELDDDLQSNKPTSDDINSNGPSTLSVNEGREKLEAIVVGSKAAFTETKTVDKISPLTEVKPATHSVCGTSVDPCSKSENVPVFPFSLTPSLSEFSGLKCSASPDLRPDSLNSLTSVSSGAVDAQVELKIPEPYEGENKITRPDGDSVGLIKASQPASDIPTSPLKNTAFSFVSPANNSDSYGVPSTSSPNLMSKTPASASSSSTHISSSISAASSSSLSASTVTASYTASPIFKFGSSLSSASVSAASTALSAEKKDINSKSEKGGMFGNTVSSRFGNTSFGTASTGISIFGFSALANDSSSNSQSQGSLFGTGSGSLAGTQEFPAEPGVSTLSQSTSIQFGSSAMSPFFGTSGIPSSSSSLIALSISPAKPIASDATFGLNSSASSLVMSPVSSSSVTTAGVLTFGASPASSSSGTGSISVSSDGTPSIFAFGVSAASSGAKSIASSTSATASIFSFGVDPASSSGTNSISSTSGTAIIGSSTPATASIFSFGVGSASSGASSISSTIGAASISSSTSATASIFSFGVGSASSGTNSVSSTSGVASIGSSTSATSSSAASSGTNSVSSTSVAASGVFGSSWQPNMFGSPFSSPSPSWFSFGAFSTSIADTSTSPMVFGAATGSSTGSIFSFSTVSSLTSILPSLSQSQPIFGNSTTIISASPGYGDQMNMEDSMAEDPLQASAPAVPIFGQSRSPPSFIFGSAAPSPATSFQFGGQQNQASPLNVSSFQSSSSLDSSAGGSFSLGSGGGGDKSGRKIVKANRNRNRRK